MADALNRLWAKYLPETEARVELVYQAALAMLDDKLLDPQREDAQGAAHKLAGTLGTFGLQQGTELAREAENLLGLPPVVSAAPGLASLATQLREIVRNRN